MELKKIYRRIRLGVVLIFLVGNLQQSNAQEDNPLGSWYIYNGFFNLSPKIELFFETQVRTWEVISNPQVFFFRPYFNYNFTDNFQAGLGLEYHMNWTDGFDGEEKIKTEEFRTTIMAMLYQHIGRVSVQHRYRYEFRFLDESGKQRLRYRLQLSIPLSKPKVEKGVWFTTLGNEIMVNTQQEINLSQNRTYAMVGYQITRGLNFQFGYMYIARPDATGWHRLQFLLTQKLFFYEN